MGTIGMLVRLAVSMAVVVGLMWLAARGLRGRGGRLGAGAGRNQPIEVLARRGLSKGASLAVVRAGNRTVLLGVTDAHITLLADSDTLTLDVPAIGAPAAAVAAGAVAGAGLGGPDVVTAPWRGAVQALRERTVRRV